MDRHLKLKPIRFSESPVQGIGKSKSKLLYNIKFQEYGSI